MSIVNNTEYNINDIVKLLIEIFGINNANIHVNYVPSNMQAGNIRYLGITKWHNYSNGKVAQIFVEKGITKQKVLLALCHEFVHIKQYYDGRLKIGGTVATFDGSVYDMMEVDYMDRPWEIEAYTMQGKLYKKVKRKMKDEGT